MGTKLSLAGDPRLRNVRIDDIWAEVQRLVALSDLTSPAVTRPGLLLITRLLTRRRALLPPSGATLAHPPC